MNHRFMARAALYTALALSIPGLAQAAEPKSNTRLFLEAADRNDMPAMAGLLKRDVLILRGGNMAPAKFLRKIEGCYLRALYQNNVANELMAVWMCTEGKGSRTVHVNVGGDSSGALLWSFTEFRKDRPAPERTKSVFTDETAAAASNQE